MSVFEEIIQYTPNFDLRSFISGVAYATAAVVYIVGILYILPLSIRFLKGLIEKIIFSIRKRNSPPSGDDK